MAGKAPKPPGDPHITLRLKSTAGEQDERFNRQNKAQKILDVAIEIFTLNPTPPSPYVLERKIDGRVLSLDAKISELDLEGGDLILIKAGEAIDG
jgi:hypothetical protein